MPKRERNMDTESFYGVILSEKEPLAKFEVDESDKYAMDVQKLIIKQICLGVEAKEGEFNVVQVETKVSGEETLKIPLAVLKAGETRALRPNVEFPSASVMFKLVQGAGPVYIYGQHVVTETMEEDTIEEWYNEDEDGDDEYDAGGPIYPQTNGRNSNKKK